MPSMPEKDPIEAYLDQVCGQFLFMPTEEIERTREELRQHIEAMADAIVEADGEAREAAIGIALVRFGYARTIGRRIAEKSPLFWMWRRANEGVPKWLREIEYLQAFMFLAWILSVVLIPHYSPITFSVCLYFLFAFSYGIVSSLNALLRTLPADFDRRLKVQLGIFSPAVRSRSRLKTWIALVMWMIRQVETRKALAHVRLVTIIAACICGGLAALNHGRLSRFDVQSYGILGMIFGMYLPLVAALVTLGRNEKRRSQAE